MKVVISFDPDPSRIGKTVDVSEGEAARLISEGRATAKGEGPTLSTAPTIAPPLPDVVPPLAFQPPATAREAVPTTSTLTADAGAVSGAVSASTAAGAAGGKGKA